MKTKKLEYKSPGSSMALELILESSIATGSLGDLNNNDPVEEDIFDIDD